LSQAFESLKPDVQKELLYLPFKMTLYLVFTLFYLL
jgi:hypothetical protein